MMLRIRQFVKNHRKAIGSVLVLLILCVVLIPSGVFAETILGDVLGGVLNGVLYGIAWLIYFVAWLGGQLLLGLTVILVWVASYNGFMDEKIVSVGWTIVRDLCNMAFIIALLYMAFNAVFGLKKGGSLLPLIINAGLINFSKVISGFVIDISQVVMLTFVHGFYKIAGGNILEGLGFTAMFQSVGFGGAIKSDVINVSGNEASIGLVVITILIALIMIYIAVGIILTFIIVLVGRIFKLWGLLIVSPVPFVKKILPGMPDIGGGGGNYWGELSKAASAGPILAFWLWLVFTSVRLYQGQFSNQIFGEPPTGPTSIAQGGTLTGQAAGFSQAGSIQNILGFIIFIGMLMIALQQAQSQANAMQQGLGKFAQKLRGGAHKWTMKGLKTAGEGLSEMRIFGRKNEEGRRLSLADMGRRALAAKDLALEKNQWLRERLTKDGKKDLKERRHAEAKGAVYSTYANRILKDPDLAEQYRGAFTTNTILSQAGGSIKDLKESGALDDQDRAQFQFDDAIRSKSLNKSIGIAMYMAEKGWGVPKQMMEKIRERFSLQSGSELDMKLSQRLEDKAGSVEGSNKFIARAVSEVRKDPVTNKLTLASVEERIADADEDIQEKGDFHDVDDAFKRDKKFWDLTNIAEDPEEVQVRFGNLASWAKKTRSSAKLLRNPVEARKWLNRWGSKPARDKMFKQIQQLVGVAKRHSVPMTQDQINDIEALGRLFSTPDEAFTFQDHAKGKVNYNVESIINSVDSSTPVTLSQKKFDNKGDVVVGTEGIHTVGTGIFVSDASGTVTKDITEKSSETARQFMGSVLAKDEQQKRTSRDKPIDENERVAQELLERKATYSEAQKREIETTLGTIEKIQQLLTNGEAKSKEELLMLRARLQNAMDGLAAIYSVSEETGVVNEEDGTRKSERKVFEDSRMKMRFDHMMTELKNKIKKHEPAEVLASLESVPGEIVGVMGKRDALAVGGVTDVEASTVASTSKSVFQDSVSSGDELNVSAAAGIASNKAFVKGLGTLGSASSMNHLSLFAKAAANAGIEFHKAKADGKSEREQLVLTAAKAAYDAGFTPSATFGDQVWNTYKNERVNGSSREEAFRFTLRDTLGGLAISDYSYTPADAGKLGDMILEGFNSFNGEVESDVGLQKVQSATEDTAKIVNNAYAEALLSGGDGFSEAEAAGVAAGLTTTTANAAALAYEASYSGRTDPATGKMMDDDNLDLDKKERSRINSASRGLSADLGRSTRTPKEKEYKDNRRRIVANKFLTRCSTMLAQSRRTDSLQSRIDTLERARVMLRQARKPLFVKYQDKFFRQEFDKLRDEFNTLDFSDEANRKAEKIADLESKVQKIVNYYQK